MITLPNFQYSSRPRMKQKKLVLTSDTCQLQTYFCNLSLSKTIQIRYLGYTLIIQKN